MILAVQKIKKTLSPEQVFMLSAFIVNGGNYMYNLVLGRVLGPRAFADAAILITLLLILSFVAMTFQLAVAKYTVEFSEKQQEVFVNTAYRYATGFGIVLGGAIVVFAKGLQGFFKTESHVMFTLFGLLIPLYFIMSVNRGNLQGGKSFIALSITYQLEMLSRLGLTFIFLYLFNITSSLAVSSAIGISFIVGLYPLKKINLKKGLKTAMPTRDKRIVLRFFILTACYELTQIMCNNSDILLVKHYFPSYDAGLYASLALIGRVVYFVTWMLVMLLLPTVVDLRKKGLDTVPVLLKYVGYICVFAGAVVGFTFLFPNLAVRMLFGEEYILIAPLLGWYALATSFFALSNIFAYYFLSLDHYRPILIAAIFGTLQVVLIMRFHESLYQVVLAQVVAMGALLAAQVLYFAALQFNAKKG